MHQTAGSCAPGNIYVRDTSRCIVLAVDRDNALYAPVVHRNTAPMRGDVPVDSFPDMVAMGLPGGRWVIRTGMPFRRPVIRDTAVGRAPDPIIRAVEKAAWRAATAAALEARYRPAVVN